MPAHNIHTQTHTHTHKKTKQHTNDVGHSHILRQRSFLSKIVKENVAQGLSLMLRISRCDTDGTLVCLMGHPLPLLGNLARLSNVLTDVPPFALAESNSDISNCLTFRMPQQYFSPREGHLPAWCDLKSAAVSGVI